MRIGTCGSHFIGPHLRGAHQLIIGSQSCDASLRTEGVGASYNILLCSTHIRRRSSRRNSFSGGSLAGVRRTGFNLHTSAVRIPEHIEADRFANVAEFHIVVSSNTIRFHLHLLPIDKNTMAAAFSEDSRSIGGSSACDNSADKKARTIIKRLFQQKIFKRPEQPAHTSADWNLRQRR